MRKALKMSLLLGTIAVLLALTACGVDGDYNTNTAPTISITSWEGAESVEAASESDSLVFQQKIYWNANDSDGIIAGVAYRILDENGNTIATPGNEVIDNLGEIETITYEGQELVGWVVHYKEGADESIPLTSNLAKKTIWANTQYAVVNFPASDDGEPTTKISSFEVVCIDNRGTISNIARKSFKAMSSVPNCIISTSRGNPNGDQVGTGLYITFSMSIDSEDNIGIPGSDYFEYKVGKYVYDEDADSTDTAVLIEETDWLITEEEEIILTKNTTPALTPDFDGIESDATQVSFTRITAHAYNYAGVRSKSSSIEFAVKEGFHPNTVIYPEKVYALGDNHYKDFVSAEDLENYPYISQDGPVPVIYASSFFSDTEGRLTAVNSANLKVYAKWGYYGQYGTPPTSSSGAISFSDSPYDTEVGRVLNEADDQDYYSEIVAYDIRFDDAPYDFYALSQDPDNIVTHEDGTQWLRVPKNSVWSISKGLELGNLDSGLHKLEVSAIDLQYENDPTPAVLEFYLVDPVPSAETTDIMVLDASSFPTWTTTQEYADSVYHKLFSDNPNVDFFNRGEINSTTNLSINACNLAYSDLQNYKTVIYREEVAGTTYFSNDYAALKLYLDNGGNVIISAAGNLKSINDEMITLNRSMFIDFFGIRYSKDALSILPQSPPKPFVNGAYPTTELSSLPNLPALNLNLEESHNVILSQRKGLSDLAFFAEDFASPVDDFVKVIYTSKIKNVGDDAFSPANEDEFNQYNQRPIAIGRVSNQNKCYAFGFPLSFMQEAELSQLFEQILND